LNSSIISPVKYYCLMEVKKIRAYTMPIVKVILSNSLYTILLPSYYGIRNTDEWRQVG
jgi:hypothetical protein